MKGPQQPVEKGCGSFTEEDRCVLNFICRKRSSWPMPMPQHMYGRQKCIFLVSIHPVPIPLKLPVVIAMFRATNMCVIL